MDLVDIKNCDMNNMTFSSSEEEYVIMSCLYEELKKHARRNKRKKKKRLWVKDWYRRRDRLPPESISKELNYTYKFRDVLRMNDKTYELLLNITREGLSKQDTVMRKAIKTEDKLAATLYYLATGDTYTNIGAVTRISISFLAKNIPEICEQLYKTMCPLYLKFPDTAGEWQDIAKKFEEKHSFPLCMGALDVKHIAFKAWNEDGSSYKNSKGFNSIVLLALADADNKFIYIDVGCNGGTSDADILLSSELKKVIDHEETCFPKNSYIGCGRNLPYVFVGDEGFPLDKRFLIPYSNESLDIKQKNFNMRLNRARESIEKSFAILTARFRLLKKVINARLESVEKIIQACCVLHNFLMMHSPEYSDISDEDADDNFNTISYMDLPHNDPKAIAIRESYAEYFCYEG